MWLVGFSFQSFHQVIYVLFQISLVLFLSNLINTDCFVSV
ncbi:MAG: DUF5670 family protein [Blautia faecis]